MLRLFLVLLLGLAACISGACAAATSSAPAPATSVPVPADPLPAPGGTDHWVGAPDAPISVEEYGDLQ